MDRQKKIWGWIAGGLGALFVLLVVVALALPRFINLSPVKEKILVNISQAVGGEVACERVALSLLPRPRVLVHEGSISIPGRLAGSVEAVTVYPKILPLLRADLRLAKLLLEGPALTLRIPEKLQENRERQKEGPGPTLEQKMASPLAVIASKAPGLVVQVRRGTLDLRQGDQSVLSLDDVDGRLNLPPTRMACQLTCKSNLWEGLSLEGQMSPQVSLELEGRGVDVHSTRKAVLALAGDIHEIQNIFNILQGGEASVITFRTHGSSVMDLAKLENILIKGSLRQGRISIAQIGMDLDEVHGDVVISQGILEGSHIEARLENARGREMSLRLGLKGRNAPFHLEAEIETDLVQLRSALQRFVRNGTFLREMNGIYEITGQAVGRLILGERIRAMTAKVDVSQFNLLADYDRIPYLLEISQGRFTYDKTGVYVEDVAGKLGTSSVSGLSAGLKWGKGPFLEVKTGKTLISLGEVYPWLTSFEKPSHALNGLKSLKGAVALSALGIRGPLLRPEQWHVETKGKVENVVADVNLFSKPVAVTKGAFEGGLDELSFTGLRTDVLDASLSGTGILKGYAGGLQETDVTFGGTLGPEASRWISDLMNFPPEVNIRAPLSVSQGRFLWERDHKTSFAGRLAVQDGPQVSVDICRDPDELMIRELLIQDDESQGSLKLNLRKKMLGLEFAGHLTKKTIDGLLIKEQFPTGWIRGAFKGEFLMDHPTKSKVQGRLQGENLIIPWMLKGPVKIESLSLDSQKNALLVESATVTLGENRMALVGKVSTSEAGFLFDMALSADSLEWNEVTRILGKEKAEGDMATATDQDLWDIPFEGVLRLQTDHFKHDQYDWSPLCADLSFARDKVAISVSKAHLCGISTPGIVTMTSQEVKLDFEALCKGQELDPVLTCFGYEEGSVTGTFDLEGRVMAQGKGEAWSRSLQGDVEFVAKKGRIHRYGVLAKILAFVNVTEVFRGKVPDLKEEGFAYDAITAKATIQDGKIVLSEGFVDGPSMEIAFHGDIDLKDKNLDLQVLVAPLKTADFLVKRIPVVGRILGGTLVSIPMKVTGPWADPTVTPLSASGVGSRLLDIMERTVKLPVEVMESLPSGETPQAGVD
ncbi:MAG: AsmA-like C-terminal domain-containing protein [Thermodesulfobacteriota bacterium]|nr:AsmA-like C-terminal domain-containing protein [Thermodesulfobacteriota bacterium]